MYTPSKLGQAMQVSGQLSVHLNTGELIYIIYSTLVGHQRKISLLVTISLYSVSIYNLNYNVYSYLMLYLIPLNISKACLFSIENILFEQKTFRINKIHHLFQLPDISFQKQERFIEISAILF